MEFATRLISVFLATATPLLLIAVLTLRFIRQRRRISARRVPAERAVSGNSKLRRTDRAVADRLRIEDILRANQVCRLGFADDAEPYVVPMSYGLADAMPEAEMEGTSFMIPPEASLRIYFHGADRGRKLDIMERNPTVCFEVDLHGDLRAGEDPCSWTVEYESVLAIGKLSIVTDPIEVRFGLETIMKHHGADGDLTFPEASVRRTTVLRLDVHRISGKSNISAD